MVRPEQSNAFGPAAPYRYGSPFWYAAICTALARKLIVAAWARAEPSVVPPLRAMKPATGSSAKSRTLAAVRRGVATGNRAAEDRELGTRAVPSGRLRKMTCRVRAPKLPRSLSELHPEGDRFRSP